MSNTREKVLETLLARQRCTINNLADTVGINPISVRHHINKLEAAGLVASEEERHGVGRPRLVYFLTEKGIEQFPSRYLTLTVRLLEQLKENMPESMVGKLFTQMADDLAADYASELALGELPIEERLNLVKDLLSTEGFTMEWELKEDGYHIREISCPYYHIGQSHPEVCTVDETLISNMLSVPIEKVKCILDGDSHCTYIVLGSEKTTHQP
ncbi:MAG: winged helix-turn-helix transcriptional regulator [Chloroflexi bacterium]|nr:winged helix-turn-helix transcriptional regulator [Chloroflexota bacterium]